MASGEIQNELGKSTSPILGASNVIKNTNSHSNLDYYYGPWTSSDDTDTATDIILDLLENNRLTQPIEEGFTIAVKVNGIISEYWYVSGEFIPKLKVIVDNKSLRINPKTGALYATYKNGKGILFEETLDANGERYIYIHSTLDGVMRLRGKLDELKLLNIRESVVDEGKDLPEKGDMWVIGASEYVCLNPNAWEEITEEDDDNAILEKINRAWEHIGDVQNVELLAEDVRFHYSGGNDTVLGWVGLSGENELKVQGGSRWGRDPNNEDRYFDVDFILEKLLDYCYFSAPVAVFQYTDDEYSPNDTLEDFNKNATWKNVPKFNSVEVTTSVTLKAKEYRIKITNASSLTETENLQIRIGGKTSNYYQFRTSDTDTSSSYTISENKNSEYYINFYVTEDTQIKCGSASVGSSVYEGTTTVLSLNKGISYFDPKNSGTKTITPAAITAPWYFKYIIEDVNYSNSTYKITNELVDLGLWPEDCVTIPNPINEDFTNQLKDFIGEFDTPQIGSYGNSSTMATSLTNSPYLFFASKSKKFKIWNNPATERLLETNEYPYGTFEYTLPDGTVITYYVGCQTVGDHYNIQLL